MYFINLKRMPLKEFVSKNKLTYYFNRSVDNPNLFYDQFKNTSDFKFNDQKFKSFSSLNNFYFNIVEDFNKQDLKVNFKDLYFEALSDFKFIETFKDKKNRILKENRSFLFFKNIKNKKILCHYEGFLNHFKEYLEALAKDDSFYEKYYKRYEKIVDLDVCYPDIPYKTGQYVYSLSLNNNFINVTDDFFKVTKYKIFKFNYHNFFENVSYFDDKNLINFYTNFSIQLKKVKDGAIEDEPKTPDLNHFPKINNVDGVFDFSEIDDEFGFDFSDQYVDLILNYKLENNSLKLIEPYSNEKIFMNLNDLNLYIEKLKININKSNIKNI